MKARSWRELIRVEFWPTPFCPGCGHGILMGAILRAMVRAELDPERTAFVSGIGCAGWIPTYIACDALHTPHGRAIPHAAGIALTRPDLKVIVVGGDGDIASIGGNHLIHAARRDIPLTVICANNAIYGMTGGQTSPTTPPGERTVTAPRGTRERPFDLCALAEGAGAGFVARCSVSHPRRLEAVLSEAFIQKGFSFVEVLSPCPTQVGRRKGLSPVEYLEELRDRVISIEVWEKLPEEERAEKIPVGVFVKGGERWRRPVKTG